MGEYRAVVAVLLSASLMFGAAACTLSAEPSPETNGARVPDLAVQDDDGDDEGGPSARSIGSGSPGGDPVDRPGGLGGPGSGVLTQLDACLALASAPVPTKEVFCDTLLPNRGAYARCMSHRFNRLEWINWCYFEF